MVDRHRQVRHEAWTYAGDRFRALQAEGFDVDRPDRWGERPDATASADELHRRTNELVTEFGSDYDAVLAALKHVVDVREAEARSKRTLQWLAPSSLWRKVTFDFAREQPAPRRAAKPARPKVETPYLAHNGWCWDNGHALSEAEIASNEYIREFEARRGA